MREGEVCCCYGDPKVIIKKYRDGVYLYSEIANAGARLHVILCALIFSLETPNKNHFEISFLLVLTSDSGGQCLQLQQDHCF